MSMITFETAYWSISFKTSVQKTLNISSETVSIVEATRARFTVLKRLFYRGKLLYRVWPTLPGKIRGDIFP